MGQEVIFLPSKPGARHKTIQSHPFEDRVKYDVSVAQAPVITDEGSIAIAGDKDAVDGVAANGNTICAASDLIHIEHGYFTPPMDILGDAAIAILLEPAVAGETNDAGGTVSGGRRIFKPF